MHCVSIEHKLGIKASPTAVLQFGDHGGAVGYLVGEENRGLEYMFIMMNAARYAVGVQGIAVAERAYQLAAAYAKDRVQGRPVDGSLPGAGPIIHHPDVKRMLLTMRAMTEGCRALALAAAAEYDHAHASPMPTQRKRSQAAYEFLVPLVKGFSTEMSLEVDEPGRAGARRHGLHRGDRRRAVPARREDPQHLRRHDRDPGQRPGRAQDRARRRRGGDVPSPRRSRPPKARCATAAAPPRWRWPGAWAKGARPSSTSSPSSSSASAPTRTPPSPARCPTCCWPATWRQAGNWRARCSSPSASSPPARTRPSCADKIAVARFYAEHVLTRVPGLRDSVVDGAAAVTELPAEMF